MFYFYFLTFFDFLFFFSYTTRVTYFFFLPITALILSVFFYGLSLFISLSRLRSAVHFICSGLNFIYFLIHYLFYILAMKEMVPDFEYFFSTNFYKITFFVDGVNFLLIGLIFFVFMLVSFYYMSIRDVFFFPHYMSNSTFQKILPDEYSIFYLIIEFFLLIAFTTSDILVFYVAFESTLFPMIYIIGIWGTGFKKIRATYYFFLYTIMGSFCMLVGILIMLLYAQTFFLSFQDLYLFHYFPTTWSYFVWVCLFIGFAVKIPVYPFYIWLPEAHVEAPTEGSVVLAALLLKLGYYGLIRIANPFFPSAVDYFAPLVILFCLCGFLSASLAATRQLDFKRIIAYSSIAHMNFAVVGLFVPQKFFGLLGGILMMYAHAIVASGLFFLAGMLYNRYGTRLLIYYGGLLSRMPLYAFFLFVFTFLNMGFPLSLNFYSEWFLYLSIVDNYFFLMFFFGIGFVCTVIYFVCLLNYLIYGFLNTNYLTFFVDVNQNELFILFLLGLSSFLIALGPSLLITNIIEQSVLFLHVSFIFF